MAGWECHNCGGSGEEKVIEIRGSTVKEYMDDCSECKGKGAFHNGEPSDF